MARGKASRKRPILADPIHGSKLVTRLINNIMLDGKKSVAQDIVYGAIAQLDDDPKEAVKQFEAAIKNIMPSVEVRSRRVGGANYQVPTPVKHDRSEALALRWLIGASRARTGRPLKERLGQELQEALNNTGEAIRKKEVTYKMAEANRAFSHFRW